MRVHFHVPNVCWFPLASNVALCTAPGEPNIFTELLPDWEIESYWVDSPIWWSVMKSSTELRSWPSGTSEPSPCSATRELSWHAGSPVHHRLPRPDPPGQPPVTHDHRTAISLRFPTIASGPFCPIMSSGWRLGVMVQAPQMPSLENESSPSNLELVLRKNNGTLEIFELAWKELGD